MKLNEIHDGDPLIVHLIHQRMEKGEDVFFYDDSCMTEAQKLVSVNQNRNTWTFAVVDSSMGRRDLIYGTSGFDDMELRKRSANTWEVVVNNEAD